MSERRQTRRAAVSTARDIANMGPGGNREEKNVQKDDEGRYLNKPKIEKTRLVEVREPVRAGRRENCPDEVADD